MPTDESSSLDPHWERRFKSFLVSEVEDPDTAHDRAHVERVVSTARRLAETVDAALEVVVPAAWLHDCVVVPKDDPARDQASRRAAERAHRFLRDAGYPERWLDDIEHAIAAHSYSAGIPPDTLEAKVVQDADRLDALGAVGLARCFMVAGDLGHALYDPDDPFCADRSPDDDTFAIDHFYAKLFKLPETMKTTPGRVEAQRRVQFLRTYLDRLAEEIDQV